MITHNAKLKTASGYAGRPLRRNAALGKELASGPHVDGCGCLNCRQAARTNKTDLNALVEEKVTAELQRILRGEITGNARYTGEAPLIPPKTLLAGQRSPAPLTPGERAALYGQGSRTFTDEEAYTPPKVVLARRPGRGRGAA